MQDNSIGNITDNFTIAYNSGSSAVHPYSPSGYTADIGYNGSGGWTWASQANDENSVYLPSTTTTSTVIANASAVDIMKSFMSAMDQADISPTAALTNPQSPSWDPTTDPAVQAAVIPAIDSAISLATNGNFSSLSDAKTKFKNDFLTTINSGGSAETFLLNYCGIDLTNADTGAVTGSDAGGSTALTATSVVPDNVAVSSWGLPTLGSTTTSPDWGGLSVKWPTTGSSGALSEAEKFIITFIIYRKGFKLILFILSNNSCN